MSSTQRGLLIAALLMLIVGPWCALAVVLALDIGPGVGTAIVMGVALLPILAWLALSPATKFEPKRPMTRQAKHDGMLGMATGAVLCWTVAVLLAGRPFDGRNIFGLWDNWFYFGWVWLAMAVWVARVSVDDTPEKRTSGRT